MTTAYMIQIDEETGADAVWDALHDYADAHPSPACLTAYVSRDVCWPAATTVGPVDAENAERWLAACATACNWTERTTPILVIPIDEGGDK